MLSLKCLVNATLCVSLIASSTTSVACSPVEPELSWHMKSYLQDKSDSIVIFTGTVVSVKEVKKEGAASYTEIEFKPSRWLRGKTPRELIVRGSQGTGFASGCLGLNDFVVSVGEEWLIVGQLIDGKITRDKFLSSPIVGGKLPTKLQMEFKRNGIAL
jgi:hypothetical protein